MGEHEEWAEVPTGGLPNGLLPNEAASVIQVLDSERWLKAEERTAELIACIQPNPPSEERRNAVADYVQRLIMKCFPCQVFTFGSVPLKTYLPDGDIDLTVFSKNPSSKDTWANQVRDILEKEEKNENAEFHVKEVQYIQAEVRIIKCLVENIVVDISFSQLGGLCTLCFLEEVDQLINQDHLFKRSIILIKAWCYYESRILGAHHGLISTYALETLVLYIFHVFNNSFAGPLEVLYRFLEFFSKFDWENFCVSLWGPVSISSLPDVTAESPRKDCGELLLNKLFLDACSSVYAVFPGGQENQGQPFLPKFFNVIDPLRVNNNLGRSVSKGNYYRIRSAFAFGAKRLARLLDCPKEELFDEVNQFFMNTLERHSSGHRPDVPKNDLWRKKSLESEQQYDSEKIRDASFSAHKTEDVIHGLAKVTPYQGNHSESSSKGGNNLYSQTPKPYGNRNTTTTSDQPNWGFSSNQVGHKDKDERSSKPDQLLNDVQGRYLFARTRSSPELSETYGALPSHARNKKALESGKGQIGSTVVEDNNRKNLESENLPRHNVRSPIDDPSSTRQSSSEVNNMLNNFRDNIGMDHVAEEFPVMGAQGMQQEEQDIVNMMASSTTHGFNGQFHVPVNFASGHLPLPIPPSILAQMVYAQRNWGGMVPTNFPLIDTPWGPNMQFPHGLVPPQLNHYFTGRAFTPQDPIEPVNDNLGSAEMNSVDAERSLWHDQERSSDGFDLDNGSVEMLHIDDKQQSTSAIYNFVPSSRVGGSGSQTRSQQKFKETRYQREDHIDAFQHQDNRGHEVFLEDRTASPRSIPASHASSLRSKTSSESSWEGSSTKISKPSRERRGKKTGSAVPAAMHGKGKNVSDEDNGDWNPSSVNELAERGTGPQAISLHASNHKIPGFEPAQTSGSESLIPMGPMLVGPGSRQRTKDNSGVVPFAFYPTGPPVPFVTMLPFYNYPSEAGTSDLSASQFSGDETLDNNNSTLTFDSSEGLEQSEVLSASSFTRGSPVEPSEHKSDILNSDFLSHWFNLQFGRFCQNSRHPAPLAYPSPAAVPPGHLPWDGSGRPVAPNMNAFNQLMSYGSRVVPVAPLQSVSSRPNNVYQRFVDEMPRYRSGTGTYLPNPKVTVRERQSTNTRRGNYGYDRSDHHGDREGSWNINSKQRSSGRNYSRNQAEKTSSRQDRLAASESRSDRPWGSNRHESYHSYQTQNGQIRGNPTQSGSTNMAYGMYPLPAMNPNGVSSNGPNVPSVVMIYPYDHNSGYSSAEHLEFGSLGPVGFSTPNEAEHISEGNRLVGGFEEQRFHGGSSQRPSSDQPSSPHFKRSVTQRNYLLKDEDFPPLSFSNQVENDGGRRSPR